MVVASNIVCCVVFENVEESIDCTIEGSWMAAMGLLSLNVSFFRSLIRFDILASLCRTNSRRSVNFFADRVWSFARKGGGSASVSSILRYIRNIWFCVLMVEHTDLLIETCSPQDCVIPGSRHSFGIKYGRSTKAMCQALSQIPKPCVSKRSCGICIAITTRPANLPRTTCQ